jgi:HrpA-like RNA helicase
MGIHDPISFPYVSPPSILSIKKGLEELVLLGAITNAAASKDAEPSEGGVGRGMASSIHISLTPLGREMSLLPLLPNMAYLLLAARRFGSVNDMQSIRFFNITFIYLRYLFRCV